MHRVEVQHVGAQRLHVVEPARQAEQVATPEFNLVAPVLLALRADAGTRTRPDDRSEGLFATPYARRQ